MSDKYIGDFKKGQVIRVKFNTFSQAILPTAPSVALEVAIYKDSATEITTTGITQPTPNFDSKDGLHELVVDTSDSVYEIGKDYDIVFTAGTVDGKDLTRTILRTFSIENRNTDANVIQIAGQTASAAAPVTFPASVANETTVSNRPTLAQIEGSTVLAKDATVAKESTASSILTAIQNLNNLSAKMNIFGSPLLEIPDAGSTVYAFTVVVKDDEDKLVSLDASPTVTAANAGGTSRSGNLSAVANPSTGRYTFTYSVASTHPAESLRIAVSGAVSTEARYIEWIGAVVDYDTLTILNAIKLKTDNLPASPAAVSDIPTAAQIADAVLEESVDDHDGVAHSLAKYISLIKKANTIVEGTVTSAVTPTTTSFSTNVNYPTGAFKHAVLVFTNSAAINEQNSPILGYVNTNGLFTVEEPFTVAPTVGDEFIIKPTNHVHSIAAIVAGVLGQETSTSAYDSGDVGYVLRQLFALIESDGAGGWRYKASAINLGANAPAGWINVGAFANNAIGGDAIAASAVTKVTAGLFKYGDVQRWNSPANQIDVTITKV
jgi:hypothetical protein